MTPHAAPCSILPPSKGQSAARLSCWCLVWALGSTPTVAQERDAASYDGTWSVRLQAIDGVAREATLVLQDYEGTWQPRAHAPRGPKDACGTRKIPLTVQSSTRTLLAFTVWGETIAPACPNLTVTVKPLSPQVLEGTVELGSHAAESAEVHASHSAAAERAAPAGSGASGTAATAPTPSIRLIRR